MPPKWTKEADEALRKVVEDSPRYRNARISANDLRSLQNTVKVFEPYSELTIKNHLKDVIKALGSNCKFLDALYMLDVTDSFSFTSRV